MEAAKPPSEYEELLKREAAQNEQPTEEPIDDVNAIVIALNEEKGKLMGEIPKNAGTHFGIRLHNATPNKCGIYGNDQLKKLANEVTRKNLKDKFITIWRGEGKNKDPAKKKADVIKDKENMIMQLNTARQLFAYLLNGAAKVGDEYLFPDKVLDENTRIFIGK
jgi:hypothetical protein